MKRNSKINLIRFFGMMFFSLGICLPAISDPGPAQKPITMSTDMDLATLSRRLHDFDVLEFKDRQGKLKFSLNQERKVTRIKGVKNEAGTKMLFDKKYYLVNRYDKKGFTQDEYFKTGLGNISSNELTVYDLEGNSIFHQDKVPYDLSCVSENGKVVACVKTVNFSSIDTVDDSVRANPPKSEIYIYSADGQLLYHAFDDPIIFPQLSPSGNLLVYKTHTPYGDVKIVDLKTKREYYVPSSNNAKHTFPELDYSGIDDDGILYEKIPEQREVMPDGSIKESKWKTTDLFQLNR